MPAETYTPRSLRLEFLPMRRLIATLMTAMALLAVAILAPPPADAGSRELKSSGAVGETMNGYLAPVPGADTAGVGSVIADINAQRRRAYEDAAAQSGRPLSEIEAVAGAAVR